MALRITGRAGMEAALVIFELFAVPFTSGRYQRQ